MRNLLFSAVLAVCMTPTVRAEDDPFDQSGVPIEVQPDNPKAAKIVIVAGRLSHGSGEHEFFAGSAIYPSLLTLKPHIWV